MSDAILYKTYFEAGRNDVLGSISVRNVYDDVQGHENALIELLPLVPPAENTYRDHHKAAGETAALFISRRLN